MLGESPNLQAAICCAGSVGAAADYFNTRHRIWQRWRSHAGPYSYHKCDRVIGCMDPYCALHPGFARVQLRLHLLPFQVELHKVEIILPAAMDSEELQPGADVPRTALTETPESPTGVLLLGEA